MASASGSFLIDNKAFFSAPVDAPDSEIAREGGVILPKDKRGAVGSKDYKYNQTAATAAIEPKLGVAKHFVSSLDGETEEGNQTKTMYVQDIYVENLAKLEEINTRLIQYDMKRVFLISSLIARIDPTAVHHVADMWEDDEHDMLLCRDDIPWQTACYWQLSINMRCWSTPEF